MATYTWTAKDRNGKTVVKEITHDSVENSKAALQAEGYTDLKLMEDDIMDAVHAGFPEKTKIVFMGKEMEVKVTAEQRLKVRDKPPVTFARVFWGEVFLSIMFILFAIFIAWPLYRRGLLTGINLVKIALVWISLIVFVVRASLPSIYYRKLYQADDWHRWTEVLQLVEFLQKLGKVHFIFINVPKTALIRHQAKALVGLGDLRAGIEVFKVCENQPDCPSWLYKGFVAGLYDIAGQHDTALEWTRESIREKPQNAMYLDLANRLLRYKRDAVGAREAIAEAEKFTMSETAKPFYLRCLGILAYLEGDYSTAKEKLELALDLVVKARRRPYRDGHMAITRAYLTCVSGRLRDFNAARKYLTQAKEYLVATNEADLLTECEHEIPPA
jgi:tetratricopeptide (TPR) repeat protein